MGSNSASPTLILATHSHRVRITGASSLRKLESWVSGVASKRIKRWLRRGHTRINFGTPFHAKKEFGLNQVHFVYLAREIPRYALSSIQLARESSGQDVVLVANNSALTRAGNLPVETLVIEEFYDSEPFDRCSSHVTYSHEFRDGFWLKGIERFFVLEQLMRLQSMEDIFHAELDQLLFGTNELVENLRGLSKQGIFLPFRNPSVPIASVFYSNSAASMASLISFAQSGALFKSDNELIAQWAQQHPDEVFALPTFSSSLAKVDNDSRFPNRCLEEEVSGLVDGAQLGHWVGGWDPRNVPIWKSPRTKFIPDNNLEQLFSRDLLKVKFRRTSAERLEFRFGEEATPRRLFNLHLHSKTHAFILKHDRNMNHLFSSANSSSSWKIPGTRMTQVLDFLTLTAKNVIRRLKSGLSSK